ncbi:MAG: tetratricopeptide repeat protein [Bacteroidaceae bacterium]|nr:tetratricopeptide repeat protein [Bacteroidaceae bacterium]
MRKILYILISLVLTINAATQPDCKSVVRVVSFTAAGDTLQQGYGFFTSAEGEVVAPYTLMRGASRAEVVDWKGVKHPVEIILGANSSYDLVRMRCQAKKMAYLSLATDSVAVGQPLHQLYYATSKKAQPHEARILTSSPYQAYSYHTVSTANEQQYVGCPLINERGEAVAVVQYNVARKAESACAIDARFVSTLVISPTSALNADLRAILMPRDLPAEENDAFSYIYMLHRLAKDSVQYEGASRIFTERYPHNVKGYMETASFYATHRNYARADEAITAALNLKDREDEVHYTLSDIIYQKALNQPQPAYKDWTLERALSESETAFALRADTLYLIQQANCLFGLERYMEAHDRFLTAALYSRQPAELYFYAANSLEHTQAEPERVIALLDSALATFSRPYPAQAANYLLARAQRLDAAQKYRAAVLDYNEYEKAVGAKNLSARFYDIRQAAEQKARMYQQALDDLHTAVSISPDDNARGLYQVEIAYLYIRVGLFAEAVEAAEQSLNYLSENPDAYRALGIAHGEQGHKADALSNLSRAQALGDEDAHTLIEQYSK